MINPGYKWKNMISVKIGFKDTPVKAIQKLKQAVSREGILNDVKKHRYFTKPSIAKRLKREEAERQRIKTQQKILFRRFCEKYKF